ncbi:MAG TPA: tRNA uridine-5-carboxymethylaminomethyl(34) synthesis GTPase MnmE [Atribacter sp.]|uniref:tRNA uridine-5-carboxymethylaminomethyl(34) synthesis GTPase MnmE n=1 Tax=Atribacter sp. TaxID=2847780 RepID=UPI002CF58B6A|nr:tRNA uridine-5-carboxymethylaminomethyl(34) synthesis GTPase MnmE [Atribacter sp.]HQK83852.1 tRNA uridine-5-carboxymethylaminomethyl(34) synthesis GTPase MnmE [Atribacter sp.]
MKKEKNQIKESIQRQERNQEIRETIVAASTPLGVGAVGIVKLSGRDSIEIASKVCKLRSGKKIQKLPSFKLTLCDIIDDNNKALDEGLVVLMREPFSYTRENVVEIQVHSSTLIIQKIIQICIIKGARLAEPGEFTKRAFLNGRISLNQAESIAEIVKAQSEKALYSLYQNLRGMFGEKISEWQKSLILIQANIQVECDFSDRIGTSDIKNSIIEEINTIRQNIKQQYDKSKKFQNLQNGLLVVICGKPNVGKSSLLNAILGKERAIVTPIPGTTRDAIEELFLIEGFPFRFVDTAGIRESQNYIEKIGINKTKKYLEEAHLVIVIFDRSQELNNEDYMLVDLVRKKPNIIVLNKSDLASKIEIKDVKKLYPEEPIIEISALSGKGIDGLLDKIIEKVKIIKDNYDEDYLAINLRQQNELFKTAAFLEQAQKSLEEGFPIDLISIDIDGALRCLKRISGEDIDKDIVNSIFTNFCIGK